MDATGHGEHRERLQGLVAGIGAAAMLAIGLLLAAPQAAHADTCTYATDVPTYKGWTSVVHPGCRPVRYGGGYDSFTAWYWNGTSWSATSASEGVAFYVWPWGNGWSWVWSRAGGWVAIRSEHVLVRRTFVDCTTCTEWWLGGG